MVSLKWLAGAVWLMIASITHAQTTIGVQVYSHELRGSECRACSHGIAQAKSAVQAAANRLHHVRGSFGAGRYEGVGYSTVSAQDAIQRSCYWGQKTPIDIGVARGRNGWYATVIYR